MTNEWLHKEEISRVGEIFEYLRQIYHKTLIRSGVKGFEVSPGIHCYLNNWFGKQNTNLELCYRIENCDGELRLCAPVFFNEEIFTLKSKTKPKIPRAN